MTKTHLTRYGISVLLILSTAAALNVAKSISGGLKSQGVEAACEDNCQQYLQWDLGLVGLEKLLIKPNDMLGNLLSSRGVEYFKIDQLIRAASSIFPFRSIRAGKELTIVTDLADSSVQALVYEPDPYRRILFHLEDSIRVEVIEKEISPFDLQKADELFITNVIIGIQPITKYRKKEFAVQFSKQLLDKLNRLIEI